MKKTRYVHYNINYHLVWIPKYHKAVLVNEVKETLEKSLRGASDDIEVISLEVMPDHVHCFVSSPPRMSPSEVVNVLKGVSSRWLRKEHPHLRKYKNLWTRTYYVGTAGNVSTESIGGT